MTLYAVICDLGKKRNRSCSSPPHATKSFYRIPSNLRNVKPRAYLPRVVSIGLIHALSEIGKNQGMNKHKIDYMFNLFCREPCAAVRDKLTRLCAESIEKSAAVDIQCYPVSTRDRLDPKTTAEIFLIDGCFILELLIKCCVEPVTLDSYITSNKLMLNNIKHDLLLLENQIPFSVLVQLYEHTVSKFDNKNEIPPLKELILKFFGNKLNSNFQLEIKYDSQSENEVVDHILGLLHSCYNPGISNPGEHMISKYSAAELHRSGVHIKPSKRNQEVYLHVDFKNPCLFPWFDTISTKFTRLLPTSERDKEIRCCALSIICQVFGKATLEIPELCITDSTESFMRNLIAYEQCTDVPRYMTSYAFLMDTLINSKEHVEMLETSGVVKNYLGSGEDASDLFNSLCQEVDLGDFYFSSQWEKTDAYYRLYWPSRIASLRRTYFNNPWTGISLFAAFILFTFTAIQTVCAIITLFRGNS